MNSDIKKLQEAFEIIKNKGWIKERRQGIGSIGYTFEKVLKKEEDNFPTPDYCGIEIKVRNINSKTNMHLFNLVPDGDYLFPIKRMLYTLGYLNEENYRVFFRGFVGCNYTKMIYGRKGIIKVNYEEEKVELFVYNNKGEDMNIGISWSFAYLKERLYLKLNKLALVLATSSIIDGYGYYHYDEIVFYKIKSFERFIELIEKGMIEISFNMSEYTGKDGKIKVRDHGTCFSICRNDLDLLFDKINLE